MGAMVLNPFFEQREAIGFNAACANAAEFLSVDELALFKDLQMLCNCRERDAQRLCQMRYRDRPPAQTVENCAARGITEGVKEIVDLLLMSWHGSSGNFIRD